MMHKKRATFHTRLLATAFAAAAGVSACSPKMNTGPTASSSAATSYLQLRPSSTKVAVSGSRTFVASGGTPAYQFTLASGAGTVHSTTGTYVAPADLSSGTSATIKVTDAQGRWGTSSVEIVTELQLSANTLLLEPGETHAFTASGGVPPYSFSIVSGQGTMTNTPPGAQFTAPPVDGTTVVKVIDSVGDEDFCNIATVRQLDPDLQYAITAVGSTLLITPTGGVAPYGYALTSGAGSLSLASGSSTTYVPGGSPGTSMLQVTDSNGAVQNWQIIVQPAIQISPSVAYVPVGGEYRFSATGGVLYPSAPYYRYSIVSGSGSVNHDGFFSAGSAGTSIVRVSDHPSSGASSQATVHVYDELALVPDNFSLLKNTTRALGTTGGVGPFSYVVKTGVGSVSGSTYSAGSTPGSAVIEVTDATTGQKATGTATVFDTLIQNPSSVTLAFGNKFTIAPTGGLPPYTFTIGAGTGGGTLSATTGTTSVFTAASPAGPRGVIITDSSGQSQTLSITVNEPLAIDPAAPSLAVNNTQIFSASGGVPPYTYSIVDAGGGSFSGNTYTAPSTPGTYRVRVRDSYSSPAVAYAVVTVEPALQLSPSPLVMTFNQTATLTASGGVPPYVSWVTAPAVLPTGTTKSNPTSATFNVQSGLTAGSFTVTVTDSKGNSQTATVTINTPPPLTIASTSITLVVGDTEELAPTGGVPPYSFAVVSGTSGSLTGSGNTRTFTASAPANTSTVVRITDTAGTTLDVTFNVKNPVTLSAPYTELAVTNSVPLTVTDGVPPYTFVIDPPTGGSISGGLFTASNDPGTVTLEAVDARGHHSDPLEIIVRDALQISPSSETLLGGQTRIFKIFGGVEPFTLSRSIESGTPGSISPSGALAVGVRQTTFTGDIGGGIAKLTVSDARGNTFTTNQIIVGVQPPASPPEITFIDQVTLSGFRLNWNGVPNSEGYSIRVGAGAWIDAGNVSSYVISGLNPGDHTVTVRAYNAGGVSGNALPASQTICNIDQYLSGTCLNCSTGFYTPGGAPASCANCSDTITNSTAFTYGGTGAGINNCPLATLSCVSGYSPILASKSCTACSAGSASDGTEPCTSCSPGSAAGSPASSSCTTCTPGSYAPLPGATSCTTCSPGTYQGSSGATVCGTCSAGSYSGAGATSCATCSAGTYSSAGSGSCTTCAAGRYSSAGSASCSTCSAGSYSSAGSSSCSTCSAGTYSSAGSGSCTTCAAGRYSSAGSASCSTCSAGTFSAAGSGTCSTCSAGSYSAAGSGSCTTCSPGSYSAAGAGSCTGCAPGTFNNTSGSTSCSSCGVGTYQNLSSQTSCKTCTNTTVGQYWTGTGGASSTCPSASCTNKPANATYTGHGGNSNSCAWSCNTGSTGATCTSCLAGYYWTGTTCAPQVCTPNSTQSDTSGCSGAGTRTRTCAANGSAWGSYGACSCNTGYTGATCSSCASGYSWNGSACVAQICTPSTWQSDVTGCSSHGTRYRQCSADGLSFGSYGACTCDTGYTGSDCASCASGYSWNGSACVAQVCTPNSVQSDTSGCSGNGTRSRTCAANGLSWGSYGSCSCSTGYTGSTCASCASGYSFNGSACVAQVCSPSSTQSDTSGCSSHGTRSRTCAANGLSWGSYGSCSCDTGYTGSSCESCASGYVLTGGVCRRPATINYTVSQVPTPYVDTNLQVISNGTLIAQVWVPESGTLTVYEGDAVSAECFSVDADGWPSTGTPSYTMTISGSTSFSQTRYSQTPYIYHSFTAAGGGTYNVNCVANYSPPLCEPTLPPDGGYCDKFGNVCCTDTWDYGTCSYQACGGADPCGGDVAYRCVP